MSNNLLIFWIVVLCVMCSGEPDLIDALIYYLMK